MKRILWLIFLAVSLSVITGNMALAQSKDHSGGMQVMTFEKGSVHILAELGAIIVLDNDRLKVQMVQPANERADKYRDVDLQEGDQILMLNGKKLTSIQDLEDGYKVIEIGEEAKFAIKRGDIMMITTFPKADPNIQTNTQTMVVRTQSNLPACQSQKDKPGTHTITIDESSEGIMPALAAGIILAEDDEDVKIMALLPNAGELYDGISVLEGDIIRSVQKKNITSSKQFSDIFENIPVGEQVDLLISRKGEEIAVSFTKRESPKIMKISDEN